MSLADLYSKRLVIVVGKGGVGRTTVAAALSTILARQGRTTLLYQANAKEKLASLLGGPPVGEGIIQIKDKLYAVNTNPAAALHEYGLMVLRYETIYKMVFENRFAKALVRAIPGVDDYAILGKLWWHTTESDGARPKWDTIVFDAPATGHAATMMKIPRAILDAVPEGPLTRGAQEVQSLITDPARTAVVIVALAEEMPTNESIELAQKFRDLGIPLTCVVVNQLSPERFHPGTTQARILSAVLEAGGAADDPVLAPTLARARLAVARRELNERYLARLEAELPLPMVRLPLLYAPTLGPAEVQTLARSLEEGIASRSSTGGAAA